MALPIEPIPASVTTYSQEDLDLILRYELGLLGQEIDDFERFRDYYDGRQELVFGTAKFKETFGSAFEKFRSNWCGPVVDAMADKLLVEGLLLGTTDEERQTNDETARTIWNILRRNDIDEQQSDLHEGALVEGRGYVIVWPSTNPEQRIRVDWNPADLMRVRYADDDPRKIVWAMKRWLTPSGNVYITVYTPAFIYKYVESSREMTTNTRQGIDAIRPNNSPSFSYAPRTVPGEDWPLRNPFGVVPVVEFINKHGSELDDVIPLQDGVNYLMLQAFTAAGFQGFPQRGFFSGVREPEGGWSNEPGKVWQVPPDLDAEGALHYGSNFEFGTADLGELRSLVEMTLQHLALQSKTPVRMFFESDRGGRGDSPSGESLLVEDQPLLDKVEDRQRRFGNAWYRVAQLISRMDGQLPDELPIGEARWKDPRSKYRSALIEEGAKMVKDMGMPLKFVVTQLGFTQDEIDLCLSLIDVQAEEEQAKKEEDFERSKEMVEVQAEARPAPAQAPPQASPRPPR